MNYSFAVTIIFSSNNHFLYVLSTKICLCPMVFYLIFIDFLLCRLFNPIDLWISILLLFFFFGRISILLRLICYITELSSRLIIFINALDWFLSLKGTRIMVGGLLCKSNYFRSYWSNSTLMIEYWRVDLEQL